MDPRSSNPCCSRANYILLYEYTFCLSIALSMSTGGCFHFLAIMTNVAMNIPVQVFRWTCVFNSLGYATMTGIGGSYSKSMFNWGIARLFSKAVPHFTFLIVTCNIGEYQLIHTLTPVIIQLSDYSYLSGLKANSMEFTNYSEHHFICLLAIYISTLEKCLLKYFAHFFFFYLAHF